MRVPFSWLTEYVDWQGAPEELAELLTMSGTEVEGVEWVGAPRDAVLEAMAAASIAPQRRPQTVTLDEFARLAQEIRSRLDT